MSLALAPPPKPRSAALLPASFNLEECVQETIKRQLARPYNSDDPSEHESVIRTRFPIYDANGFLYTQDAHLHAFSVYGARLILLEVYSPHEQSNLASHHLVFYTRRATPNYDVRSEFLDSHFNLNHRIR